ncbi:hypothetical protein QYF36_003505 [Acer negundo]|nr:hypothetical protein QYF36_003505 [Acer negundo]
MKKQVILSEITNQTEEHGKGKKQTLKSTHTENHEDGILGSASILQQFRDPTISKFLSSEEEKEGPLFKGSVDSIVLVDITATSNFEEVALKLKEAMKGIME